MRLHTKRTKLHWPLKGKPAPSKSAHPKRETEKKIPSGEEPGRSAMPSACVKKETQSFEDVGNLGFCCAQCSDFGFVHFLVWNLKPRNSHENSKGDSQKQR